MKLGWIKVPDGKWRASIGILFFRQEPTQNALAFFGWFNNIWNGADKNDSPKSLIDDNLNFKTLLKENDTEAISELYKSILKGNILSFFKGIGYNENEMINVLPDLYPKSTKFKGNEMTAFDGGFTSNVILPDLIGLGKSVSRGFGAITKN